jgi:RND family efflux transporter MFP subunit
LIGKDTEIYTISDPTDLWLLAEIKERDIGAIKVGQEATFTVLAYPEESFRGKIVLVGNRVETDSRTLEIRIAVANTDGRLKPGMFADVEIATTALPNVLVIPDEALQKMDDDQVVFVAASDTRFEKRVIKTGLEQHGHVQVVDGLKEGDRIVTTGSFILKSELLKGELGEE